MPSQFRLNAYNHLAERRAFDASGGWPIGRNELQQLVKLPAPHLALYR